MSHMSGRVLSDNKKILNFFNKKSRATDENCCSVTRSTADCKCSKHCKTDVQHKMKRLKTRKERGQMRGGGQEASKTKLHHHHCHHQSSKDMAHIHRCCHSSCHCSSQFPSVVPASHEPSIITDSRLIGHHGLFNHEVKSVDIERLLSEQGKLRKSGQKVQEKAISHPSSSTHFPSSLFSKDLLCTDTDEVVPLEKKADPAINIHDDCMEEEKKSTHGSDVTPGQRPQQQLDLSSQSYKSIFSSKHSSPDVVIIRSKKADHVMPEKKRASQLTPTVDRETVKMLKKKEKTYMISTLVSTPKNQEPPENWTQAHGLNPSPLQLSSSLTADSFDIQHGRHGPVCVSMSVSAIAARLCDSLQFPLLKRKNLVAESREVLLKALYKRHGPQCQENLLKEQTRLSFGTSLTKAVQDHDEEPIMIDEDASVFQGDTASQPCFNTQKTTSFKIMGSSHFNWKSILQSHQSLEQTAEWLRSPDTSASLLDEILRPRSSPQFSMDFEPSGASARDHLSVPSSTSYWGEKASASQHWEDSFNRPTSKESVIFDCFESSFMDHTTAVREKSCGPHYNDSNTKPLFPYQSHLPDRHSAEQMHFPQEQDPFETYRYSFAPSFSAQIHHPNQSNHFQPFSQFSHPLTCPPLRSHHTYMMHYPPSHMLERDPAPPLSSLPSPEHWSFPPMKLY
ncbi:proline-rich protein 19 isoform X2 [Trachinotus anak]